MSPARARTWTAQSGDERTNHETTVPPRHIVVVICLFVLQYPEVNNDCAVPENIHTPPTEEIVISWGWGVLSGQKLLRNVSSLIEIFREVRGSYKRSLP